jgi:hypothetical protein
MRADAALHVDVRLLVGRPALVREPLEGRLGVAVPQLRAGVASASTFGEDIDGRVEPDGNRPAIEQLAGARVDERAAAGRNHAHVALVDEAGD